MTPQVGTSLRLAGWSGMIAVAGYVGATVLGGVLDPEYSHLRDAISTLTAAGAPDRVLLGALYVGYNLLLAGFALAVYRSSAGGRLLLAATVLFALGSVSGIGQVTAFPQDAPGSPLTGPGTMHLVLAGVSSLVTVACAVLYWRGFRTDPVWRPMSRVSLAAAIVILASAPGAVVTVGGPVQGLFERVTIGAFMVWIIVLSAHALRRQAAPVH